MMKKKIIFIVGPTAVGKTEVAAKLAAKINAEIISCDSMQIYKGMDILTSKPQAALMKKIPHHLIGLITPKEEYNVSQYRKAALAEIKNIFNKGKIPLFVGGTGLYMTILLDGIFKMRPPKKSIRIKLLKQAAQKGSEFLYNRLKKVDPEAAAKIHPHDARRIVRALEVFIATGKPISYLQKQRKGLWSEFDVKIFCLNLAREKLKQRIDGRVDAMFRQGAVREVKKLAKLKLSKTACFAIGIKEIKGYLDGEYDLAEAKELMQRNTRAYAKRQLTWFRKDKRIKWVEINEKQNVKGVVNKLWNALS